MIKQATGITGYSAFCDEPKCANETFCGPDVDEGFELVERFGWLIARRSDGPAMTFCPEHAGHNIFTHSKTGADVVAAVIEKPEPELVHYGTIAENACNQDHLGTVTLQPNIVTCPRCLEVLAARERRLTIGDHVETTADAGSRDWDEVAARERIDHWGKRGHVGNFSDAHGLVFKVFFEDGHSAWYEPGELREVPRSTALETVDHPAHYGGADDPYEAIKVIEAWQLGFCLGNTVKYIARAGKKGDELEDLRKAAWYLQREIARLEAK